MMPSQLPVYIVDTFTSRPFHGNPTAVYLIQNEDDEPSSDDIKLKIADELKFPSIAFVTKLQPQDAFERDSHFHLRWFTSVTEIDMCGHATLATAVVLFQVLKNPSSMLTFETRSGPLYVTREPDGKIVLDLPALPLQEKDANEVADFLKATIRELPVEEVQISRNEHELLIRLKDDVTRSEFESLKPDYNAMIACNPDKLYGVIVTLIGSRETSNYDFFTRYFGPTSGVPEDPATGGSHAALGPYWSTILKKKSLVSRQCSERSGDLWINVRDDDRVDVAGYGVVVFRGTMTL